MQITSRRGFTLIECAAIVCVAGAALACFSAVQPEDGVSPMRKAAWEAKDKSQVRVTVQALTIMLGATGQTAYPLPSTMDAADATVAEKGSAKDTTANIFSILIWNGAIATETCISPAEVNESIRQDDDYTFDRPPTAVKPTHAMWDPAFSADFREEKTGNLSYANLQPSGGRVGAWKGGREHAALEPVVANRGPEIAAVTPGEDGRPDVRLAKEDSNTLRIHGPEDSWEGMVAYNDGHAARVDSLRPTVTKTADGKPTWINYKDAEEKEHLDVYFFDEQDNPKRDNFFLGIFTKAGAEPEDYEAIWD